MSTIPLNERICRDPDDDPILEALVGGEVDCWVTGDKDLLEIKRFRGVPILSPSDFWHMESNK